MSEPNVATVSTTAVITGWDVEGNPIYRSGSEPVPHGAEQPVVGNVSFEAWRDIPFSPCAEAVETIIERQEDYGDPDPIYAAVGRKWAAHLSLLFETNLPNIPAKHVYLMLAELKGTREASKPKRDNLRDKAGYVELAARARR